MQHPKLNCVKQLLELKKHWHKVNLFYTKNSYQDPARIYQGITFAVCSIAILSIIFKKSITKNAAIIFQTCKKYRIINIIVNNNKFIADFPIGYCKACHQIVRASNRIDDVINGCTFIYECNCGYPSTLFDLELLVKESDIIEMS